VFDQYYYSTVLYVGILKFVLTFNSCIVLVYLREYTKTKKHIYVPRTCLILAINLLQCFCVVKNSIID
jgi:uncharacterized membrane protein